MNFSEANFANIISAAIRNWVVMFPMFVMWGIGILIALARWRRHPKVSLLVVLSCGLSLAINFVTPILHQLAFSLLQSSSNSLPAILTGISLVGACLAAVSIGLMLFAVFTNRPENEPSPQFER